MTTDEQTITRVRILEAFLRTPHRNLKDLAPLHQTARLEDPLFYAHMAVWAFGKSQIRDHKVLAVVYLLTAPSVYEPMRSAGWRLLQSMPPHMVAQAVRHIRTDLKVKSLRMLKSAVENYLRALENDFHKLDNAALRGKDDLKYLYATLRIKPAAVAQKILFDEQPQEGSRMHAVTLMRKAASDQEVAELIVKHHIPYVVAASVGVKHTPLITAALVSVMTPAEVQNHLKMLEERGALKNPELRKMIEDKIAKGAVDTRVQVGKASRATAATSDDGIRAAVVAANDAGAKKKLATIKRNIALFVDKSSSTQDIIQLAREEVAPLISQAVAPDKTFRAYVFDTGAKEIKARSTSKSDWQKAFALITANGGTNIGAPFALMIKDRVVVDMVAILTDMDENTQFNFILRYGEYVEAMGVRPKVVVIGAGSNLRADRIDRWTAVGIEAVLWKYEGDYFSLPNVLELLNAPGMDDLVTEILSVELPTR